ncbi:hypothetical protein R1sor_001269 [Riccia sorocarpa]|uniref:Uncharacterized protein n=1 Tax=Riccia sorocarpa TaxID=122646 RepID=A0ABD3GXX0_9MARC
MDPQCFWRRFRPKQQPPDMDLQALTAYVKKLYYFPSVGLKQEKRELCSVFLARGIWVFSWQNVGVGSNFLVLRVTAIGLSIVLTPTVGSIFNWKYRLYTRCRLMDASGSEPVAVESEEERVRRMLEELFAPELDESTPEIGESSEAPDTTNLAASYRAISRGALRTP